MTQTEEPTITPAVLEWVLEEAERIGITRDYLLDKYPELESWEAGNNWPTYAKLKQFAQSTKIPYGHLLRPEPPKLEDNPIADFRTLDNKKLKRVSWNLRETIYMVQRRQNWLHEYLQNHEVQKLGFVGSIGLEADPQEAAVTIREALGLAEGWAAECSTYPQALTELRSRIEALGISVMVSSIVGNNTRRRLDREEFRGFSLADNLAPMIFVNGADFKPAQMFTLAHELVHVWLGQEGTCLDVLDNVKTGDVEHSKVERFCNQVAAEMLTPENEYIEVWNTNHASQTNFKTIARQFKVSQYVAAIRAYGFKLISKEEFNSFKKSYKFIDAAHRASGSRTPTVPILKKKQPAIKGLEASKGVSFYHSQNTRLGKQFATNVIQAAKERKISYIDACDLTGLSGKSLQKYADYMGIDL